MTRNNKGQFIKGHKENVGKKSALGYKHTEEAKNKIGAYWKGRKRSESFKEKQRKRWNGKQPIWLVHNKPHTEETKKRMSKLFKDKGWKPKIHWHPSGKDCHLWRGGITPINHKIRSSTEYKLW